MRAVRPLAVSALATLLAACSPEEVEPGSLRLVQFKQADAEFVYLNEALVLQFDAPVDGTSVTSSNFDVRDAAGRRVRGRVEVDGPRVRFVPELPRSPGLDDGSFLPDQEYELAVGGYPRPDGVRSRDGLLLDRTWRFSFRTVDLDASDAPFQDVMIARTFPHYPRLFPFPAPPASVVLEETAALWMDCDAPLDPRTIDPTDFDLRRLESGEEGRPRMVPIPCDVRLIENRSVPDVDTLLPDESRRHARLELRPVGADGVPQLFAPGEYHIYVNPHRLQLTDLGGRQIAPTWGTNLPLGFAVTSRREEQQRRVPFLDPQMRSTEAVEGTDGWASWSDRGVVTVRYPAAAGTGAEGRVQLGEGPPSVDVHATYLELPATSEAGGAPAVCTLPPSGLVVLRAQNRMTLSGRIERRVEDPERTRQDGESVAAWLRRVRRSEEGFAVAAMDGLLDPERSLSDWLEDARARDEAWTVLIAGGDLVVDGEIDVDGPLLLVAGGFLRIPGTIRAREVWKLREGGGPDIEDYDVEAGLWMDPPLRNPLVEPLRVGIYSAPIRPPRGVSRWHPATLSGRHNSGRYSVSYRAERLGPDGELEVIHVQDPSLLTGFPSLRLLVELEVSPGGIWNPPLVDHVELYWDEPTPAVDGGSR